MEKYLLLLFTAAAASQSMRMQDYCGVKSRFPDYTSMVIGIKKAEKGILVSFRPIGPNVPFQAFKRLEPSGSPSTVYPHLLKL